MSRADCEHCAIRVTLRHRQRRRQMAKCEKWVSFDVNTPKVTHQQNENHKILSEPCMRADLSIDATDIVLL